MSGSRDTGGSGRGAIVAIAILLLVTPAVMAAEFDTTRVVNPATGQMVEAIDGMILVQPRPGVSAQQMRDLCHRMNAVYGRPVVHGAVWSIKLPDGQAVPTALREYAASGLLKTVEPSIVFREMQAPDRLNMIPNDPQWSEMWGLEKIECPEAWDSEQGDPTVVIAIIDSGVDRDHPDLMAHTWTNPNETPGDTVDDDGNGLVDDVYGWDWYDDDNDPSPTDAGGSPSDHGTHVAGTAGAVTDNAVGVAGVAWNCRLMALRTGAGTHDPAAVMEALTYAADMGADVVNMSIGGRGYLAAFQPAVDYAYTAGVTICAALGNDFYEITTDQSTWYSPVCNDGDWLAGENKIIGVAATDRNDLKADFSNYSAAFYFCDVSAPGTEILSTLPGGTYGYMQGTSMASPHTAGLAALVVSQIGRNNPAAIIDQIRSSTTKIDTLNPLYAGKLGTGRISAAGAVGLDLPPGPATAVNAFDTPGDEGGSLTVTWRRSPDDGAGRDDVLGYELWRGQTSDPAGGGFVMVADTGDLPPGSSGYRDDDPNLVDGQNYYYFVRTKDAANQVDSTVGGPASPRDDSAPPSIDTLVARDTQADEGRSITLTWAGYVGDPDITAFRVYRAQAAFSDVTEDGVTAVATVGDPAARSYIDEADDPDDPTSEPMDLTDYWYAVTAVDEAANQITAVTPAGPVQSAPNLSLTYNPGLQMITVPAQPVEDDPLSVFGIADPSEMDFARYDPLTQTYHTLDANPADPALTISPGRGFWLDRLLPSFISVAGHLVEDPEAVVPLEQGWNQVGSPYKAACPFVAIDVRDQLGTDEDITASNLVRKYGWRYDALERSYKLVSGAAPDGTPLLPNGQASLPAQESMWIYANTAGVGLVFQNNVAAAAAQPEAAEAAEIDGWQLRLVARTAGAADTDNVLGVATDAQALGKIVGPPLLSGGVDLYFGDDGERLAADIREDRAARPKWTAVVQCGTPDTDVTLSWPDAGLLPKDVQPILTDVAAGKKVFIRAAQRYTYRSTAAGEKRYFEIALAGADHAPMAVQLAAAPTNGGGVEVAYTLNRAASAVVEVRNIAGRKVATVAQGQAQEGLNRVVWTGMAVTGQRVPNGQYVVVVTATADDDGEIARAMRVVSVRR